MKFQVMPLILIILINFRIGFNSIGVFFLCEMMGSFLFLIEWNTKFIHLTYKLIITEPYSLSSGSGSGTSVVI